MGRWERGWGGNSSCRGGGCESRGGGDESWGWGGNSSCRGGGCESRCGGMKVAVSGMTIWVGFKSERRGVRIGKVQEVGVW